MSTPHETGHVSWSPDRCPVAISPTFRELDRKLNLAETRLRAALVALRELTDEQNGAPLEDRRKQWEAAMTRAEAVLRENNA